jgi:hypothetical protein
MESQVHLLLWEWILRIIKNKNAIRYIQYLQIEEYRMILKLKYLNFNQLIIAFAKMHL